MWEREGYVLFIFMGPLSPAIGLGTLLECPLCPLSPAIGLGHS